MVHLTRLSMTDMPHAPFSMHNIHSVATPTDLPLSARCCDDRYRTDEHSIVFGDANKSKSVNDKPTCCSLSR